MKQGLFVVLLVCSFQLQAQLDLKPDTIMYSHRTGGIQDTFDLTDNLLPSAFDGGRNVNGWLAHTTEQLFQDYTAFRLHQPATVAPLRYASLPHLGFSYSFGSQGTQFLHLRYTQAFRFGFKLNFDYDRTVGNGFLRESGFTGDNVRMRLQRDGQRFSTHLSARYQSYEVSHTSGVSTDTSENTESIIPLGLEFVAPERSGSSQTKMARIKWHNFINFTGDSLNHFGLVTKHDYEILNRKYFESNSFQKLEGYSVFNYDSLQTQDVWNHPSIANAGGVYFLNKNSGFYIDGTLQHRYWNSWDVRDLRDTTEIDLQSELRFEWKGIELHNSLRLNLIGGFNGWEDKVSATYSAKKLDLSAGALFSSMPANALQRFYFGNNYDYQLSAINRQVWLKIGGRASYQLVDSLLSLEARVNHFSIPSAYVFSGSEWELSDSLGSATSLQLGGHIHWKFLHLRPFVTFSTDRNGYLPEFQAYTRLYVKGRLFEAKKLSVVLGVDAFYQNGYRLRSFVPSMDAFFWGAAPDFNPGMANLHFFTSLGIDQFRFYLRFENIGYFWNDPTIREAVGYPIAGTRIRLGISWDFFN